MKLKSYQKELFIYCIETRIKEIERVIKHFPRCNTLAIQKETKALDHLRSQLQDIQTETTEEEEND